MDIQNKTILVLGGWGLVGSAICRKLVEEKPKRVIVTSLNKWEAEEAVELLRQEHPKLPRRFFVPWWGNIFLRAALKDLPREATLQNKKYREMLLDDLLEELTPAVLKRSSIFQLLSEYTPDIVIDCINSATAIAYQDLFQSARLLRKRLQNPSSSAEEVSEFAERLMCTLYVPQLIRHVQLLYKSMQEVGCETYVKIGTSGTGGMGLNIPYTHSEERPSRVLLGKSAVAGAHTLMLFLMGRTPDAPITKEIKPAAAIGWKRVAFGEIKKRGKVIELVDCAPEQGVKLKEKLELQPKKAVWTPLNEPLKSVFVDTGENGMFSRMEYEAISTPGQMEFVTPEEIAESVIFEIKGGNTGHDIINALDNASLNPTYRAGFMFEHAIRYMKELEQQHQIDSVAFEVLGPPRLSKLLYEAHLLRLAFKDMKSVAAASPKKLSEELSLIIKTNQRVRSQILSIGIPILMNDGETLLRGKEIKIPPFRGENELTLTRENLELWAIEGWVDLRQKNMTKWIQRFKTIMNNVNRLPKSDTSSRYFRNRHYWEHFNEIHPGKLAGWIFSVEERGARMKA